MDSLSRRSRQQHRRISIERKKQFPHRLPFNAKNIEQPFTLVSLMSVIFIPSLLPESKITAPRWLKPTQSWSGIFNQFNFQPFNWFKSAELFQKIRKVCQSLNCLLGTSASYLFPPAYLRVPFILPLWPPLSSFHLLSLSLSPTFYFIPVGGFPPLKICVTPNFPSE